MSLLTLTVEDQNEDAIVDAMMSIYDSTLTNLITSGRTNGNGVLAVSVPDGTYKVLGFANGYAFSAVSVTVNGATGSTVTGTKQVISSPGSPDLCRVYLFLRDLDGSPLANAQVVAGNLFAQGTENVGGVEVTKLTDAQGLVYFDLVQGLRVRFSVKGTSISRIVEIPAVAQQNLMTLAGFQTDAFAQVGEG